MSRVKCGSDFADFLFKSLMCYHTFYDFIVVFNVKNKHFCAVWLAQFKYKNPKPKLPQSKQHQHFVTIQSKFGVKGEKVTITHDSSQCSNHFLCRTHKILPATGS